MANDISAKLLIQIAANTVGLNKSLTDSSKQLASFTSGLTKVAGALGIAFGASQIIQFAKEINKLAGEAQGVSQAFDKLPDSERLMRRLEEATHGTVSELELMKRAVQAQNFNINLEQLPKLLDFATRRAQQTGESIDYLVNSIVNGIGRKSPLILDNLGISAARLREEFEKTGDFAGAVGIIVEQELSKMPDFIATAATESARLAKEIEDFKVNLGGSTGLVTEMTTSFAELVRLANNLSDGSSELGKVLKAVWDNNPLVMYNRKVFELIKNFNDAEDASKKLADTEKQRAIDSTVQAALQSGNVEAYIKALDQNIHKEEIIAAIRAKQAAATTEEIRNISFLQEQLKGLQQEQLTLTGTALSGVNQRIQGIQSEIKALKELGLAKQIPEVPVRIVPTLSDLPTLSGDMFTGIEPPDFSDKFQAIVDGYVQIGDAGKYWADTMKIHHENVMADLDRQTQQVLFFSSAMQSMVSSAIMADEDRAKSLAATTIDVIDSFQKQAIAAAIARAMETPGPLPIGLIAAGVGITAVLALFRKAVGTGGSGGGSSGMNTSGTRGTREAFRTERAGEQIQFVQGEFVMRGNDLVQVIHSVSRKNQRLGGPSVSFS